MALCSTAQSKVLVDVNNMSGTRQFNSKGRREVLNFTKQFSVSCILAFSCAR